METFGRASFSQNGFNNVQIKPTMGQSMGQALRPSQKQIVQRMQAAEDKYSAIFDRNATIPLDFRVTGDFQHQVVNIADQLWADWIKPFNDRPNAPYWNDPAPTAMLTDLDNFQKQVAELDRQVSAAELKAGGATTPASTPPTGVSQAGMLSTSGALLLGLVAVGSFVGAVLLGQGDPGFMLAGKKR